MISAANALDLPVEPSIAVLDRPSSYPSRSMSRVPLHPDLTELPRWLARLYNECTIWQGALDDQGYPRARPRQQASGRKTSVYVHRRLYESRWGLLAAGERVYRLCGSRRCINPYHLTTQPSKTRRRRLASARLNAPKVRAIRQAWASPIRPTQAVLAAEHGVSRSAVSLVVRGLTWRHV